MAWLSWQVCDCELGFGGNEGKGGAAVRAEAVVALKVFLVDLWLLRPVAQGEDMATVQVEVRWWSRPRRGRTRRAGLPGGCLWGRGWTGDLELGFVPSGGFATAS